ncbi:MAG: hypothetical protein CL613_03095 [Aquimarina sp.]|nr:hypothetical protein [Aquimarina sp.]
MKFYVKILCLSFLILTIGCKENNNSASSESSGESGAAKYNVPYTSKMTKADKKKYFDANDNVVYEVKYKPDGFKLRTPSSTLLWKVKLYDQKIKISDNEENHNPYEIKIMGSNEAKLVKEDKTLARLKYEEDAQGKKLVITDDSGSKVVEAGYAPSYLVQYLSEIPKDQKDILINELVSKGY